MPRISSIFSYIPFGIIDFLIILAFLSLVHLELNNFAGDPGLGWHLKNGENILLSDEVPFRDSMLAWQTKRPWVADQWLADVFMAWIFEKGSWPLLYAVFTSIFLVTYFLVLYQGLARTSGLFLFSAFVSLFSFKLGQVHFILRPVMLSFLFFAISYLISIYFYRNSSDPENRWNKKTILLAVFQVFLFYIWANIHPSFIFGLFLTFAIPIAVFLDDVFLKLFKRESDPIRWLVLTRLIVLCLCCFLATYLNPYGLRLHETILWFGKSEFMSNFFSEWEPPNFSANEGQLFLVSLGLIALFSLVYLFSRSFREDKKLKSFYLIILLPFIYLSFDAVRILPFYGIVVTYPLIALVKSGLARQAKFIETRLGGFYSLLQSLDQDEGRRFKGQVICLAIVLATIFSASSGKVPFYQGSYGFDPERYPSDSVAFLREKAVKNAKTLTVLNFIDWGGFISYSGEGLVKAVIDDRSSLLREDFFREYLSEFRPDGDFRGYAKSFNAKLFLIPTGSDLYLMLKSQEDINLIFEGRAGAVFELFLNDIFF